MTIADDFVAAARAYIGTPFHHQGRMPDVGLDCAGVIVCAAAACGIFIEDQQGYGRIPSNGLLQQAVEKHCVRVDTSSVETGDIMLFAFRNEPQHLAVYDHGLLIHAYSDVNRVVENSFDETWQHRLRGCWRLKGAV